jgi:hypothetical protein
MKHYVRIFGGAVAENITVAADADIATMFHPSVKLVAVTEPLEIGVLYHETSNTFSPAPAVIPSQDELKAYAAARRWLVETGGVVIGGIKVATDRESQSMLNAAYNLAQGNPSFSTMWKGADGNFNVVNAETMIALAQTVGAFVASCFTAEAAVVNGINAGNITTIAQVDAAIVVPA